MLKGKNKTHARLGDKTPKSKNQLAHSDGFISLAEASGLCTYSQEYLSLLVRKKLLQGEKFGRNWFTKKEWLEKYVLEHPIDKHGYVKGELLEEKIFKEKIVESRVNKNLRILFKDFSVWLKNFFINKKNLLIQKVAYSVNNLLNLLRACPAKTQKIITTVICHVKESLPIFFVWKKLLAKQIFEKVLVMAIIFSLVATTAGAEFFPEHILKAVVLLENTGKVSNQMLFTSTDWVNKKLGLGKIIESAAVASENFSATTSYVVRIIVNGNASGSLEKATDKTGGIVAGVKVTQKKSGQNFLTILSGAGEKISNVLARNNRVENLEWLAVFIKAQQVFSQIKNLAFNFLHLPDDSERILVKATEKFSQIKIFSWLKSLNKNSEQFSRLALSQSSFAAGATQLAAAKIFRVTERISNFVARNIFNPIADLGHRLGNGVVYVAKSLGFKIGDKNNAWLARELITQNLIKNLAGRKNVQVVKEFGEVKEIVREIQNGEKIIVLKGEKGEKGDTGEKGEKGEAGPSGASGNSGNINGGTTIINNVYNIAPGSEAKDGAGSAFAAKYLGASELSVSGQTTLNTLSVSGAADFNNKVTVAGNLQGGNVISAGYLKVGSGDQNWPLTAGNAYLAGNLETDGSLKIDAATTTDPAVWITANPVAESSLALLTLGPNKISAGSSNGTFIGANPTTFSGDFINFQVADVSKFKVDKDGNIVTAGTASHSGTMLVEATSTPQLTVRYDTDHQWQSSVDNKGNLTFDLTSATNTPEISFLDPFNISTSTSVDVFNITASTTENILDIKSSSTDYLVKFDQMGAGGIFDWQKNEASVLSLSNEGVLTLQNASSTNSIISVLASSTAPLAIFNQTGAGSVFRFDSAPAASSTIALLQMTTNPMAAGSSAGTFIAANPQSFSGNFLDFQIAGARYFSLASDGDIFSRGGILMQVNSTTALSIRDANDATHFVIDTTRGHYGFATSSPADGYGLTIATSTLQYGDWYNYGNATSSGVLTVNTQIKIATSTTDSNYKLGVAGAVYIAGDLYGQGNATTTGTQIISGQLGIATTTLPYALNVAGSGYLTGNFYVGGNSVFTGGSSFNSVTTTDTAYIGGNLTVVGVSDLQ
ncbi:hypothetical protein COX27_01940, partial [Candidatus Kuenenbacteria bacterium CG23_combo_of_CG06-09_8_20_14_all_36_9]